MIAPLDPFNGHQTSKGNPGENPLHENALGELLYTGVHHLAALTTLVVTPHHGAGSLLVSV